MAAHRWGEARLVEASSDGGKPGAVIIRCMSDDPEAAKRRAVCVVDKLQQPKHLGTQQPGQLKVPVALVALPDTK